MVPLADFLLNVRPDISGCPEIQLKDAVLRAGIDFCKQTTVATKRFLLTTVAGTAAYNISDHLDEGTEIDSIVYVKREQNPLEAASADDFEAHGWDDPEQSGTPLARYLSGTEIILGPIPEGIETLQVKVKVRPTLTATGLPDELYKRYDEAIGYGAKAKLMAMRNKPWSDPEGAALNRTRFIEAIGTENTRYARGAGGKPLRVRSHFF